MLARQSRRSRTPHFELIPMIDVMMILTIFLAAMAFLPQVQTAIQAQLPEAATGEMLSQAVTIELTVNGLSFQQRPLEPGDLAAAVKETLEKNPDTTFTIAADRTLSYDQVISLLDRVRASGATRITLATAEP